jgi:hypothetical protein
MKLKCDFVTNSSTTAYMIIIPENFSLDKYLTIREQAGHGELNPKMIERIKTNLQFCERDGLSSIFNEYNEEITDTINLFKDLGLSAGFVEIDGYEGYHLVLVSAKKVKTIEKQFLEKVNENKK